MFGKYYVDGYAVVDGKQIIFEYNGCAYHSCERCSQVRVYKNDEDARKEYFKNLPDTQIISISGCEWHQEKFELKHFQPTITPLLWCKTVDSSLIVNLIKDGKVNGFCIVDLNKTKDSSKWLKMNFPPILQKEQVFLDDLPSWMQDLTEKEDFPKMTILQKMHAKQLLLHTSLLQFYLENGFEITKIHKFYEYQGARCFEKVFRTVYEARVQATETHDEMKATAVKLVSNSMYGSLLLVSIKTVLGPYRFTHPHDPYGPHYPQSPHGPHIHTCPHDPHGPHDT